MKKTMAAIAALILIGALWYWLTAGKQQKYVVTMGPLNVGIVVPGKVEAVSQEIRLSFDLPGIIEKINVKEGDVVEAEAVIAELRHDDLKAKMDIAKWELEEAKARRDRIVHGPRAEEIEEAQAVVRQYESESQYQETKLGRKEKLTTAVSKEEVALAKMQFDQSSQKLAAAEAQLKKLKTGSRPEEIQEAEATVRVMEGRLAAAQSNLNKAFLKAPIAGKVVRVGARVGESVMEANEPVLVATLADMQQLQIRAEVDETHIQQVIPGQKAWVTADAFAGEKFPATVMRVLDVMGRKKTDTDDPKAKVDTRVLEVLLDVAKNESLKLGLRVDVQIQVGDKPDALLIPRSFVTYVGGTPSVLGYAGAKQVLLPVILGVEQGEYVEIRSGLKQGDVIVRRAN